MQICCSRCHNCHYCLMYVSALIERVIICHSDCWVMAADNKLMWINVVIVYWWKYVCVFSTMLLLSLPWCLMKLTTTWGQKYRQPTAVIGLTCVGWRKVTLVCKSFYLSGTCVSHVVSGSDHMVLHACFPQTKRTFPLHVPISSWYCFYQPVVSS